MPRELITNVWASDNQGYGPGTANGPMLPDHLCDDFDERPEVFVFQHVPPSLLHTIEGYEPETVEHDLPPVPAPITTDATEPAPVASLADSTVATTAPDGSQGDHDCALSAPPEGIERLDKPALLAVCEAHEIDHDKRWGVKRLRAAIEAHRG